jgi:Concanavalin A-like lectin/glucanases superfamily
LTGPAPLLRLLALLAFALIGAVAFAPHSAHAQAAAVAVVSNDPQTARFTGSNGIDLPGHETLDLGDVSTIEFWVRPGWTKLGQDPVILSAIGDNKLRYAVFMAADKQGIGLYSDRDSDLAEFDFSDGAAHHVAFVNQGELTDVYVDGELADTITVTFDTSIATRSFHIGSADGTSAPFTGAIGEIRLWDTALEGDDIAAFMRTGILSKEGLTHPDIASLVGVSDFANGRRNFALVNNAATMRELYERLAVARGLIVPVTEAAEPLAGPDGKPLAPLTAAQMAEMFEPITAASGAQEQSQ